MPFDAALGGGDERIAWSASAVAVDGTVLHGRDADVPRRTASVGKLLLLLELARAAQAGELSLDDVVRRDVAEPVRDSGLWQHLVARELTLGDAALLVGAVSDNLATNALLHVVGLPAVRRLGGHLGLRQTRLHDVVRDVRLAHHPPTLSTGSAAELAGLFAALHERRAVSAAVSERVLQWLAAGCDLSMVASAFGLDPLAHAEPDRGLRLWHKTGTDAGVRADTGLLQGPRGAVAYAVLGEWPPEADLRDDVLAAMRRYGEVLRAAVG